MSLQRRQLSPEISQKWIEDKDSVKNPTEEETVIVRFSAHSAGQDWSTKSRGGRSRSTHRSSTTKKLSSRRNSCLFVSWKPTYLTVIYSIYCVRAYYTIKHENTFLLATKLIFIYCFGYHHILSFTEDGRWWVCSSVPWLIFMSEKGTSQKVVFNHSPTLQELPEKLESLVRLAKLFSYLNMSIIILDMCWDLSRKV